LKDIVKFLIDINHGCQLFDVCGSVERMREIRARIHLNLHSHRLWDNEDITENYGCIEEPGVPLDRL